MDDSVRARLERWVNVDAFDLRREADIEQIAGKLLEIFWQRNAPEAFELLVILTHDRLFGIGQRITRRLGVILDADDLVATLFKRLFVNVNGTKDDIQHFFAFAHTSMRNEALNQLRKLTRASNRHVIYETRHRALSPPPDPAAVAESRETTRDVFHRATTFLAIVHACFHDLRERDRRVLMGREVDGLSYDELADSLDLPRNQIGMILKRARERLEHRVARAMQQIEARTGRFRRDDEEGHQARAT